ncbi:MAG: prolipoprotein diacylglyceryl transferase [Anaerolineae bacterium]|nr:prolipoprotein diacylglyceryl transferase [Anaerolineae bacterium]
MNLSAVGFEFGPVTITWFALIALAALATGGGLGFLSARRRGLDAEIVLTLLTWMLVGGMVVGRLIFILNPPPSVAVVYDRRWFLSHFFDLQIGPLAFWSGGIEPAGVLIGAVGTFVYVIKRSKLDLPVWFNAIWPGALLFLVIAPWANVPARQLFGPPTRLPWGMVNNYCIPPYDDLSLYPADLRFHPTPVYVSLWALLVVIACLILSKKEADRFSDSTITTLSMVAMSLGLFLADFLRIDVSYLLFGLTGMQVVVLVGWLAAGIVALIRNRVSTGGW